jgi:hypothetical protein
MTVAEAMQQLEFLPPTATFCASDGHSGVYPVVGIYDVGGNITACFNDEIQPPPMPPWVPPWRRHAGQAQGEIPH